MNRMDKMLTTNSKKTLPNKFTVKLRAAKLK